MTIINITTATDGAFAVMAADTLVMSADDAVRTMKASKVEVLPHLPALLGVSGPWQVAVEVGAMLRMTATLPVILDAMPEILRHAAARHDNPKARFFLAGVTAGRVVCTAYDHETAYDPQDGAASHFFSPGPDQADPSYPALQQLSGLALTGSAVDSFHIALAENQYRALCRERDALDLPDAIRDDLVEFGGELVLHRLDRDGAISVRRIWTFPDAAKMARPRGPARAVDPLAAQPAAADFFGGMPDGLRKTLVKPAEPEG